MVLIIEILLFVGGLYVVISGKMPSWIAGKGYKAEGMNARLIGGLMALPLPLAFCAGAFFGLVAPDYLNYASVFEVVVVFAVAIAAALLIRRVRIPDAPPQP